MGLYGIVGQPDDEYVHKIGALEGNGKTCTMTHMLQMDKIKADYLSMLNEKRIAFHSARKVDEPYRIITNNTTYIKDAEKMTFKDMVLLFKDKKLNNGSIGVDELGTNLNSLGEDKIRMSFYALLLNQARKGRLKIYYTQQNQRDLIKKVRDRTNPCFIPEKYHKHDNTMCINPLCEREHFIKVFLIKPAFKYLYSIDCATVGKLYHSDERIDREELSDDDVINFLDLEMESVNA